MKPKKTQKKYIDIKNFCFHGSYCTEAKTKENSIRSGMHIGCEIYICLSQSVSFIVENKPYRVKYGDIIITRPYEAHRYVCLDNAPHKYFCIEIASKENESLLELFFGRNAGEDNLISLPNTQKEILLNLCHTLAKTNSNLKKTVTLFKILELITERGIVPETMHLPEDIKISLDYINANLKSPITIPMLAEISHVTVNTLERHFKSSLGMSPREYLQNCRFVSAISIMKQGGSVMEAAEESGFADYSYFIALFKKKYGKTPYQFKKEL